jgi:hypothetical protein
MVHGHAVTSQSPEFCAQRGAAWAAYVISYACGAAGLRPVDLPIHAYRQILCQPDLRHHLPRVTGDTVAGTT